MDQQRKEQLTQKYGAEIATDIINKRVVLGMTPEMCQEAWGVPFNKCKTTIDDETATAWVYGYKIYLYFVNNELVKIRDIRKESNSKVQ